MHTAVPEADIPQNSIQRRSACSCPRTTIESPDLVVQVMPNGMNPSKAKH
jgi:hypothetical protein